MTESSSKITSIDEAAARIPDGATVAIGGPEGARRPLALLRALARGSWRPGAVLSWAPAPEAVGLLTTQVRVVSPVELAAAEPDVLLLQAEAADEFGAVLLDDEPDAWHADRIVARAAGGVIASVEQLVSPATVRRRSRDLVVGPDRVQAIVHAPFGAHPLGYPGRYPPDPGADLAAPDAADHWAYLDAVGFARLVRRSTISEGDGTI